MFMTHDEIGNLDSNDYPGYKVRDTGGQVLMRDAYKQRGRNNEYQKRWETIKPEVGIANSPLLTPTRTTKKHVELVRKAVRS